MPEIQHELHDPEVNAAELEDRSERIGAVLDHVFEEGLDEYVDGEAREDAEKRAAHFEHPKLRAAYLRGWDYSRADEEAHA